MKQRDNKKTKQRDNEKDEMKEGANGTAKQWKEHWCHFISGTYYYILTYTLFCAGTGCT